ncbi:hypothetical protein I6I97_22540 [Sphingobacterium multivorum]|uniref:hypothetical protein n=1 Tax=Sphingobacterium multivorum TaxID=28454 RepID=UPI001917EB99|nr:hypothetical protein [Sphingobacterium multivorum]QQT61914.1 hypothetical protein I6I97_22540 [Sphingobacterium multivorum]
MKKHPDLRRLISNSYNGDHKFAINYSNIEAAQSAILEANKNFVGFNEYLDLHIEYLIIEGCSVNHINEQLRKVSNISSYFINA